jgi:hypothetical protein
MRRLVPLAVLLLTVAACSHECDAMCIGPSLTVSATPPPGGTFRACVGQRCQLFTIAESSSPSAPARLQKEFRFDLRQLGLRAESETAIDAPGIGPLTPFRASDGFDVRVTMIRADGSQVMDKTVHADHRFDTCCGDYCTAEI